MTGPVLEVAPDRLLGYTDDPEVEAGGLLYGVDLQTGTTLFRRKLPARLGFTWSQGTESYDYRLGPDGKVYGYLGPALVRIHPADARVEILGKVSPAGRFCFAGDDLYLTGTEMVRRIRKVTTLRPPG